MEKKNYHRTISVSASPEATMKKISQVNRWWKKDFSGSAGKVNDRFTVPFGELSGESSFVDFMVTEMTADKKTVWKVTDCNLPWFSNKKEWKATEVVFELSEENGKTRIDFTHVGLVPEVECYEACEKGWDSHVTRDLLAFIDEEKTIS
ncbi:MAG TPA: SRPBCC domain-containing protein [Bacteroidia bacterium]|nr:SRPBCC domain-containing protein [Bacteroidia bacterium]